MTFTFWMVFLIRQIVVMFFFIRKRRHASARQTAEQTIVQLLLGRLILKLQPTVYIVISYTVSDGAEVLGKIDQAPLRTLTIK